MGKFNIVLTTSLLGLFGLVGCGSNEDSDENRQIDAASLNTGDFNAKPHILCSVKKTSNNFVFSTFGTDLNTDKTIQYPSTADALQIDCRDTYDGLFSESEIVVSANVGGAPLASASSTGKVFSVKFDAPGSYPIRLAASNPSGFIQEKVFQLVVTCGPDQFPPLAINTSRIQISNAGAPNLFSYSATGAVSGGSGEYVYAWDFSGLGSLNIFDETNAGRAWLNPALWSESAIAPKVYTAFAGTRQVQLSVRDTQCNFLKTVSFAKNFDITRVPAGSSLPLSVIKPTPFLQANVSQASPQDKHSNGQFIAIEAGYSGKKKHVQCGYNFKNPAGLTVYGLNWFDREDKPLAENGINFTIEKIPDSGTSGTQRFSSAGSTMSLTKAQYLVAETADDHNRLIYQQVGACQIELLLNRAVASTPCPGAVGNSKTEQTVEIEGKYNCPRLVNGNGTEVKLDNGFFFCEVSKTTGCPGGGGGGGGIPPQPM